MTSLPMPDCVAAANPIPPPALPDISDPEREQSEQFLVRAFRSFAEAAGSLERSYGRLRAEVSRLHGELEQSNAGLERSLEENRRMRLHLDRILERLPCGVLVTRADGSISLMNPEGRKLLKADTAGRESVLKTLADTPKELRELLARARACGGEPELCLANQAGDERWLAARHAAIEDVAGGGGGGSIFILHDISAAKRLASERDRQRREQALAEMAAILAHEIRNPLGSLELFAGLLAGAGLAPNCCEWVEQLRAGLRTLAATVNNVLHFHSLPAPACAPTDLGQLLDWAGGFLLPMARQARVELCLCNRLHGVTLAADRHCLEQVLLNLALNSLRAMPGGGWVEISGQRILRDVGAAAVIAVNDTGPGVSAAQAEKIFEPGFSTRAGSPGLGLAVCRKIVEQHGGTLVSAGRGGTGASFIVTFPLAGQEGSEEAA